MVNSHKSAINKVIIFLKRLQKTAGLSVEIGRFCQVFYQIEKYAQFGAYG
jgi:hypothetical protein